MEHPEQDNDPYLDTETGVLKNSLGITDAQELEDAEKEAAARASYSIQEKAPEGSFDLKHLQAIHRTLFSRVYPWAGELRKIDISKDGSYFARHTHIERSAQAIFSDLATEKHLAGLDHAAFSARAAHYLSEINALHPFRDGNGRAQREFIGQLARKNGYYIAWERMQEKEMQSASKEAFRSEPLEMTSLIERNTHVEDQTQHREQDFYSRLAMFGAEKSSAAQERDSDKDYGFER